MKPLPLLLTGKDLYGNQMELKTILDNAWKYRRLGNYQKCRDLLNQVHSSCQENDHIVLGRLYHVYMQIEWDHHRYNRALKFCKQALQHYSKSENLNLIAHSRRHLADLQRQLGMLEESEANYCQALDIYRSALCNDGDLANALRGYGLLLEGIERPQEAQQAWLKVKEIYEQHGIPEGVQEAIEALQRLA